MTEEIKYSKQEIRDLLAKYFEASITPSEMEMLQDAATSCDDIFADDPLMLADLRMIADLSEVSEKMLVERIPDNLESRLDRHISRLARKSNMRRKWILSLSSAAAVAVFMTVGINLLNNHSRHIPESMADTGISVTLDSPADSVIQDNARVENKASSSGSLMASAGHTAVSPVPATQKNSSALAKVNNSKVNKNMEFPVIRKAVTEAIANSSSVQVEGIVPVSELFQDVTPVLASAIIKPSDVLAQPLSTLSQAVDNVYESLEMVAKVFSEVNSTLEAASNGLAAVTEIPFQSI